MSPAAHQHLPGVLGAEEVQTVEGVQTRLALVERDVAKTTRDVRPLGVDAQILNRLDERRAVQRDPSPPTALSEPPDQHDMANSAQRVPAYTRWACAFGQAAAAASRVGSAGPPGLRAVQLVSFGIGCATRRLAIHADLGCLLFRGSAFQVRRSRRFLYEDFVRA